jgi:hypothetical protein
MPGGTYGYIAIHGGLAALFFFVLQRFVLNQTMESSLLWGGLLGAGAAGIAWLQTRRGR